MPLKLLARFRPDAAWTLGPGDMLYLPPDRAHEGVALDPCTTYSIGFRAPSAQDLATAFLDWLRDRMALSGRYADPGLGPSREPARIGAAMQAQCAAAIARVRWTRSLADVFLGCYLTEPKPDVTFRPPPRPLAARAFAAAAARRGLRLDPATRLLYDGRSIFINGGAILRPSRGAAALERLANTRQTDPADKNMTAPLELLYQWYCDGFLHLR
jgi:50S ribosomal protein L16 3-hydroxylase